jgi:hypothetical protein
MPGEVPVSATLAANEVMARRHGVVTGAGLGP